METDFNALQHGNALNEGETRVLKQ